MSEKLKEWYYKYGFIMCGSEKEIKTALDTITEYNAQILSESSIMYKLMCRLYLNGVYDVKKVYAFKAKNKTEASAILNKFMIETNGFWVYKNEALKEEES